MASTAGSGATESCTGRELLILATFPAEPVLLGGEFTDRMGIAVICCSLLRDQVWHIVGLHICPKSYENYCL